MNVERVMPALLKRSPTWDFPFPFPRPFSKETPIPASTTRLSGLKKFKSSVLLTAKNCSFMCQWHLAIHTEMHGVRVLRATGQKNSPSRAYATWPWPIQLVLQHLNLFDNCSASCYRN